MTKYGNSPLLHRCANIAALSTELQWKVWVIQGTAPRTARLSSSYPSLLMSSPNAPSRVILGIGHSVRGSSSCFSCKPPQGGASRRSRSQGGAAGGQGQRARSLTDHVDCRGAPPTRWASGCGVMVSQMGSSLASHASPVGVARVQGPASRVAPGGILL